MSNDKRYASKFIDDNFVSLIGRKKIEKVVLTGKNHRVYLKDGTIVRIPSVVKRIMEAA